MAFLIPSIQYSFGLPCALFCFGIHFSARQVKGEHPDKERYNGPPGWGLGRWASSPSPVKNTHMLKKPRQRLGETDGPLIHMISKGLVAQPSKLCQNFNFAELTGTPINTILKTAQF